MLHDIWSKHPPVGVWIGVLGLLGVVVPLIRDVTRIEKFEKAVWTFIMFALLGLEIKSVYQDRNEHDQDQANARAEQERNFKRIADGLEKTISESQQQFEATMARSDAIMAGVSDNMKMQTGGDSFAYVTFTPEPNQQFLVAITSRGKYPLREVHITMMDDERRLHAMQEFNKHPEGNWIAAIQAGDTYFRVPYLRPQSPEGPSGDVEVLGAYPFSSKDSSDLTFAFSSLNGYWNERLHLRRVNGKWHQALSVMGPTVKQSARPFIYFDPDYQDGKALAEKDWARAKVHSR